MKENDNTAGRTDAVRLISVRCAAIAVT
jgi:hypothetical protein